MIGTVILIAWCAFCLGCIGVTLYSLGEIRAAEKANDAADFSLEGMQQALDTGRRADFDRHQIACDAQLELARSLVADTAIERLRRKLTRS